MFRRVIDHRQYAEVLLEKVTNLDSQRPDRNGCKYSGSERARRFCAASREATEVDAKIRESRRN